MLEISTDPALRHKLYETMVTVIYTQELSWGDSFIDLGASIGHHTWQMATRVGSAGRGIAIEPVPDFAARVRNVLAHKKIDWVDLINVAAGDYDGECSFFVQPDHIGWSSMFSGHIYPGDSPSAAEEITVPVRRLDDAIDLASRGPLSVIKVDVENAEFAALRGLAHTIGEHRPSIIFENNPLAAAKIADYDVATFFDFFTDLEYELFSFYGEKIASAQDWSLSKSVYYLASPTSGQDASDFVSHYGLDEVIANFAG